MKAFSFGVLLFGFWLLLSGHLEPLLLGLGLASVALSLLLAKRMDVIDHESYPVRLSTKLPGYYVYLFKEIILANIDVIKRILKPGRKTISPQLVKIPLPQKTELGRVIYANSITLTPGTVSVELTDKEITVHALSKEAADELIRGVMARAIPEQEEE
jgi:multicomponent Na+:H+ antiporter subunit E